MRLTPGQKARIERELPSIELDNEWQYRMLQKVLHYWNNSQEMYVCNRLRELAYPLIAKSDNMGKEIKAFVSLERLTHKLSTLRFGCTITQHLSYCNRYVENERLPWLYENENAIRYRWVVKILLANRERLGIKVEG